MAVHSIPRSGLRVHRRRRIFRKVPRESLLQKNHYASWEYLVRIPKTRSHGNHYLSDSNWRKNPCAEYLGGEPSWMLFCTGNVFRKTVPRLFHLCDLNSKSSKANNNTLYRLRQESGRSCPGARVTSSLLRRSSAHTARIDN